MVEDTLSTGLYPSTAVVGSLRAMMRFGHRVAMRRVRRAVVVLLLLSLPFGRVSSAVGAVAPSAVLRTPLAGVLTVLTPFIPPPTRFGAGHRGVDLAAADGTSVRAAADGTVIFAGVLVDRGVVSIDHGALRTTYEPVSASVVAGQHVRAGAVIGTVQPGHARCVPASCLHWGARVNGAYVDPMLLLAPLRVRLKPWDG